MHARDTHRADGQMQWLEVAREGGGEPGVFMRLCVGSDNPIRVTVGAITIEISMTYGARAGVW